MYRRRYLGSAANGLIVWACEPAIGCVPSWGERAEADRRDDEQRTWEKALYEKPRPGEHGTRARASVLSPARASHARGKHDGAFGPSPQKPCSGSWRRAWNRAGGGLQVSPRVVAPCAGARLIVLPNNSSTRQGEPCNTFYDNIGASLRLISSTFSPMLRNSTSMKGFGLWRNVP